MTSFHNSVKFYCQSGLTHGWYHLLRKNEPTSSGGVLHCSIGPSILSVENLMAFKNCLTARILITSTADDNVNCRECEYTYTRMYINPTGISFKIWVNTACLVEVCALCVAVLHLCQNLGQQNQLKNGNSCHLWRFSGDQPPPIPFSGA